MIAYIEVRGKVGWSTIAESGGRAQGSLLLAIAGIRLASDMRDDTERPGKADFVCGKDGVSLHVRGDTRLNLAIALLKALVAAGEACDASVFDWPVTIGRAVYRLRESLAELERRKHLAAVAAARAELHRLTPAVADAAITEYQRALSAAVVFLEHPGDLASLDHSTAMEASVIYSLADSGMPVLLKSRDGAAGVTDFDTLLEQVTAVGTAAAVQRVREQSACAAVKGG